VVRKPPAPPVSTSGAGYIYEYAVGAIMLVHLLGHSHPPGLQVPVVEVGLNQHAHGHLLDDIVVHGESGTVCEPQVKQTVAVAAGDREFVDFLIQALETMKDREEAVSRGELAPSSYSSRAFSVQQLPDPILPNGSPAGSSSTS
jgi:hypothetical protein